MANTVHSSRNHDKVKAKLQEGENSVLKESKYWKVKLEHARTNHFTELGESFELLILFTTLFETPNLSEELDP